MDKREEYKYIYAFVFGDGTLEKASGGQNSRMQIEHVARNEDYCQFKYDILSKFTRVTLSRRFRENKNQEFIRLVTERHPRYTQVRERMYLNGVKTIDPHMEAFLDWEMLAIIYQDDGTLSHNQHGYPQVHLCLESFTWAEQKMLRDWFAKHFDLHWEVVRKTGISSTQYRLRLKGTQIPKFFEGIRPYVQESFLYKLQISGRKAPVTG